MAVKTKQAPPADADRLMTEAIAVKSLDDAPYNRPYKDGEIKALTESVRANGVLVPLIVRKQGQDRYEIVAGHRRRLAAKIAGLLEVPCVIRVLTDAEARAIAVIDNLHRRALNPIEEAEAFSEILDHGMTVPQVAKAVGKELKYVERALLLHGLPADAQDALRSGRLTAAHGHQLTRVGHDQMETVVKFALTPGWKDELPTVTGLKQFISSRMEKDLANAPFPKDVEFAGMMPCIACPYNTGNQAVLFDGAEQGHCTNGTCFSVKMAKVYADLRADAQKRWPGVAYIGAAQVYGSLERTPIKGYTYVNGRDKKVAAAAAEKPEAFGIGVVRVSPYSSMKKPVAVLMKKPAAGKEKAARPGGTSTEDREAWAIERAEADFVRNRVRQQEAEIMLRVSLDDQLWRTTLKAVGADEYAVRAAERWLRAAGIDTSQPLGPQVDLLTPETLQRTAFWLMVHWNASDTELFVAEASKVDLDGARNKAEAEAKAEWPAIKDEWIAQLKKEKRF